MNLIDTKRRNILTVGIPALAMIPAWKAVAATEAEPAATFRKIAAPQWLLAFWKEIDDKTWGKGFDCLADDAICNLGVSDWKGRETIRNNLRKFVDKQMTTYHEVVEYWDGGQLKVFRGFVTMKFDDVSKGTVRPAMTHFFYMDAHSSEKVSRWCGSVGPIEF